MSRTIKATLAGTAHGPQVPALRLKFFVLWLMRRLKRYAVEGESMSPALQPGQEVLVRPLVNQQALSDWTGTIVCVRHPLKNNLVLLKRLSHFENGKAYLLGDNLPESTDSRSFGPVELHLILGQVVCTFP